MELKKILNYKLIDSESIQITIYSLFVILLIIITTRIVLWLLKRFFYRQFGPRVKDQAKALTIFRVLKYIIWVISVSLILDTIGVKITLLVAGSAALLVGMGLGIQQIFNDIMSGIFLLVENNLKVGDIVETEGIIGKVLQMGIRTSKIITRDDIIIIIPNSAFISDKVINWSHIKQNTRFKVDVGVAYGSDVKLVERSLLESAIGHEKVATSPRPFVRFDNFGDSSLDFQLFFWTSASFEVENIKSDIRFKIDETFRRNKVEIPFPQRDLHIKSGLLNK